jgi:hypothetical protein
MTQQIVMDKSSMIFYDGNFFCHDILCYYVKGLSVYCT